MESQGHLSKQAWHIIMFKMVKGNINVSGVPSLDCYIMFHIIAEQTPYNWTISYCSLFFTCITWLFNFDECFATFQKTCNRIAVFKRTGKKEGWMPLPATIACLITLIWSAFYGNFHIGPWDMKLALPVCFTRSPYQSNYRTRATITCSWLETALEY